MENLHQHIEALVFSSEVAVTKEDIVSVLAKAFPGAGPDAAMVESVLNDLHEKFKSDIYAFELRVIGGGYQFFTKPEYYNTVAAFIGQKEKKRLSTAALETLSIIAYRGPITKGECEKIRGVDCNYSVEKLLEKELIEISGRMENAPGKPILYKVTQNFLDYFGINSTAELPKLKDVLPQPDANTVGEVPEVISDGNQTETPVVIEPVEDTPAEDTAAPNTTAEEETEQ